MNYTLTEHAKKISTERELPLEWLERVMNEPVLREPDPDDASLESRYRPIPEFEGRVLRVEPIRVVSVFFDRSKRGHL
jgi:hypothetical protein